MAQLLQIPVVPLPQLEPTPGEVIEVDAAVPLPPPPPSHPPIDLGAALAAVFNDTAYAGMPITLDLPAADNVDIVMSGFTFDSSITASEVRLVGSPGAKLKAGSAESDGGRRRALSTGRALSAADLAAATLFTVTAGAPPVYLSGLTLQGHVAVTGGTLEAVNCTFDGAGLGDVYAMSVNGDASTTVLLNSSTVVGYENGGLLLQAGALTVSESEVRENGYGTGAAFGGAKVNANDASSPGMLNVVGTVIEGNGQMINECDTATTTCLRGGGLFVNGAQARVSLSDRSVIRSNSAYEGDQIYVDTAFASLDNVRYAVPTPLGHYVIITDWSQDTPVSMQIVDATFPFECSPGAYGNLYNYTMQVSPRCAGRCPAGHRCPGATVNPIPCLPGKYCIAGSTTEVDCPAGTQNPNSSAVSIGDCRTCSAGTACPVGSATESPCAVGQYAPNNGSEACTVCPSGKFQDELGQTGCTICGAGHYCTEGARQQTPCAPGTYSSSVGLQNNSECLTCPMGFFCPSGSAAPTPCMEGQIGEFEGLQSQFLCAACIPPTTSLRGSSSCDRCIRGYYLSPTSWNFAASVWTTNLSANFRANCEQDLCIGGATCENDATLATVNVTSGYWRLTNASRSIVDCHKNDAGTSPCKGGTDAGDDGAGYCEPGHHGPRCELCDDSGYHFVEELARCTECPKVRSVVSIAVALAALFVFVSASILLILYRPPKALHGLSTFMHRIALKTHSYALLPKLKILIALYQMVVCIPDVYEVQLPEEYYRWMQTFAVFTFDWDEVVVPGACLPGGFSSRLALRGIAPLIIMVAVVPIAVVRSLLTCKPPLALRVRLVRGLFDALPIILFIAFCFCASVSSGLFAAWACTPYEVSTPEGSRADPITRLFLNADPSIECNWDDAQFAELRFTSWFFIVLWPIGMPLLYFCVLAPTRDQIVHQRSTRLVRATAILHKEYEPEYAPSRTRTRLSTACTCTCTYVPLGPPVLITLFASRAPQVLLLGADLSPTAPHHRRLPPVDPTRVCPHSPPSGPSPLSHLCAPHGPQRTRWFTTMCSLKDRGVRVSLAPIDTVVLMFVKPYKRHDLDVLSITAQISIIAFL